MKRDLACRAADGLDDVAVHDRETGNWFVGRSTGSAFVVESWVTRFGNRGDTTEGVFGGHRR